MNYIITQEQIENATAALSALRRWDMLDPNSPGHAADHHWAIAFIDEAIAILDSLPPAPTPGVPVAELKALAKSWERDAEDTNRSVADTLRQSAYELRLSFAKHRAAEQADAGKAVIEIGKNVSNVHIKGAVVHGDAGGKS